jgi:hypothetical protein
MMIISTNYNTSSNIHNYGFFVFGILEHACQKGNTLLSTKCPLENGRH